jgi:hypothetical protein
MNINEEYWKFAEWEGHINDIQSGIRNLASGWMLAAFAAIAILLKGGNQGNWLVSPAVLVGVISFMATLGLLVLWINDQYVYQRLIDCAFIIALKLEYHNPRLPPVRAMAYAAARKGFSRYMTYFYTIPMWFFVVITLAAALLRDSLGSTSTGVRQSQSLGILIVLCVIQLFLTARVQWMKSEVGARVLAKHFGDKNFTAMFDDEKKEDARQATEEKRARLDEVIMKYCGGGRR